MSEENGSMKSLKLMNRVENGEVVKERNLRLKSRLRAWKVRLCIL